MIFEVVTINDIKLSIGKICREKRQAQKLSREELATILNVSRNTIQNIEMGKNVTLDSLLRVAYHFDLLLDIQRGLQKIQGGTQQNNVPNFY
jgi:transcriptional regulator with XRE-family HTH domain